MRKRKNTSVDINPQKTQKLKSASVKHIASSNSNTSTASASSSTDALRTHDLIVDRKGKTLIRDFVQESWVVHGASRHFSYTTGLTLSPINGQILKCHDRGFDIELKIQTSHKTKQHPSGVPMYARFVPGNGTTCYPKKSQIQRLIKLSMKMVGKYIRGFAVRTHDDRSLLTRDKEPIFSHGLHLYGFTVSDTLNTIATENDLQVIWFSPTTRQLAHKFPLEVFSRPYAMEAYLTPEEEQKRETRLQIAREKRKSTPIVTTSSVQNVTADQVPTEQTSAEQDTEAEEKTESQLRTQTLRTDHTRMIVENDAFRWCLPELCNIIVDYSMPTSIDILHHSDAAATIEHNLCSPKSIMFRKFGDLVGSRIIATRVLPLNRDQYTNKIELTLSKPNGVLVYLVKKYQPKYLGAPRDVNDLMRGWGGSIRSQNSNNKIFQTIVDAWNQQIGKTIVGFAVQSTSACSQNPARTTLCYQLRHSDLQYRRVNSVANPNPNDDWHDNQDRADPHEDKYICPCVFGFRLKNIDNTNDDGEYLKEDDFANFKRLSILSFVRTNKQSTVVLPVTKWSDELCDRVANSLDDVQKAAINQKRAIKKRNEKRNILKTANAEYSLSIWHTIPKRATPLTRVSKRPKHLNDFVLNDDDSVSYDTA